jgi:predicted nucleotidyltransferase
MADTVETEIMEREPVLGRMVRRLVEVYSPVRIYLFGSKARGDDGTDSDHDLLVGDRIGISRRLASAVSTGDYEGYRKCSPTL